MKNHIGKIIREKWGCEPILTNEKLKELGITKQRFTRILKNEGRPLKPEELINIAKWLEVKVEALIDQHS
ncbi:hypothetical protein [Persicobacter psychrovividus]|uniref:HTH cro/C1-type domain-containing protein n=1 Tax=Persicobacter psychrovividus TaxID=387638 RepID=A0ABN6LGV4_9BACT|nr:hypothetical protein PEPS_29990 [Persicobacter psychrovividus]